MQKKRYKIIRIGSLMLFVVVVLFLMVGKNNGIPNLQKSETLTTSLSGGILTTFIIEGTKTSLVSRAGISLYDALLLAKDTRQIDFSGKNYSGLGFFVTDIGPLHSGNGKNLLYYINNKEASVGVSSYLLQDGDVIEWKLK